MPSIEIRPAIKDDWDTMLQLEHSVEVSRSWQMEHLIESGQISIKFRDVNLPRAIRLSYPRNPEMLKKDWDTRLMVLVACENKKVVGYLDLSRPPASKLAWIHDIVVKENRRRQGIGSALLMAATEWASKREYTYLILEMLIKNYAAIRLAMKFGFELCGYNDHHYSNKDIALFFQRELA